MITFKCPSCSYTFSDAEKAWDEAIAHGCCPKCKVANSELVLNGQFIHKRNELKTKKDSYPISVIIFLLLFISALVGLASTSFREILIPIYLIHLFLAVLISAYLNYSYGRNKNIPKERLGFAGVLAASFISSTLTIGITILLIMMPPLNKLPGGFMEGGLMLTLPIIIIVFTGIYFLVNVYAIKYISRIKEEGI